jgi:hypothetical protein
MADRLPSKSLIGKRIQILICPNAKEGATAEVFDVDTFNGNVTVKMEHGGKTPLPPVTIVVNWGRGDRWRVIPASVVSV